MAKFGAILRGRHRIGDDHRNGFTDIAHLVDRKRVTRCRENFRSVGINQRGFRMMRRRRHMGDRFQAVGAQVITTQHHNHARHRKRRGGFDAADARMRVRRARNHRIRLARQADVITEDTLAGQKMQIFLAPHGFTDTGTDCAIAH